MNAVANSNDLPVSALSKRQKTILLGYVAYGLLLQLLASMYSLGEGPDLLGAVFGSPLSAVPAPSAPFVWWLIGHLIASGKHRSALRALYVHYCAIPLTLGIQIGFWGQGRPLPWANASSAELGWLGLLTIPYIVGQIVTWRLLRTPRAR
jgi:hypothetical protein